MAEILSRFNMIPHSLLQNLRFWKTILGFAIPDEDFLHFIARLVRQMNREDASRAWNESDFSDGAPKGGEKLLCEPRLLRPSALKNMKSRR